MTLDDIRAVLSRLDETELATLDALIDPPEGALFCVVLDRNRDAALNRYFSEHGHLPPCTMTIEFVACDECNESVKTSNDARLMEFLARKRR